MNLKQTHLLLNKARLKKTPTMHRDIFRLQLTNNTRLIERLRPWQNAIYFGYNVKIRIMRNIFEPTLPL